MLNELKKIKFVFLGLFLLGACINSLDVWRPVDGRIRASWRECDYASIARNYYREGMNIFYPRVDWRGDGPGYGEMEFPIIPWSIAVLYKIFGYYEVMGRILVYLFSLLTIIVFFRLARYLLPLWSAFTASLFFVLSPLTVRISNSLQPEGLMLLCYLLAVYSFFRWLDQENWIWYGIALGATALVILVKVSAVHIGFFFLFLLLVQKGLKSLTKVKIWIFGFFALLPGALWYFHAHKFWLVYGNSLGVTNEYHWISWDLFENPEMIINCLIRLARIEVANVWMPLGGIIALAIIWHHRKERAVRISILWLLAIGFYYFIAIRTASNLAATYYHVVAVPAAALLIGSGALILSERMRQSRLLYASIGITAAFSLAIILGRVLLNLMYRRYTLSGVIIIAVLTSILLPLFIQEGRKIVFLRIKKTGEPIPISTIIFVICFFSVFPYQILQISRDLHPRQWQALYECALSFKDLIPDQMLILTSGGRSIGKTGRPVAYNASYMFFWLDRKGFNIPSDQQTLENVQNFIHRGARYFIMEKDWVKKETRFDEVIKKSFSLIGECSHAYLFKL